MVNLNPVEIKSFVPAKDFELSKRFYQTLGFQIKLASDDIAHFVMGTTAFLLQNFHVKSHSENFMMHLLVEDVENWFEHVKRIGLESEFGAKVSPLLSQPWGILEFCLTDPSGILWRISGKI